MNKTLKYSATQIDAAIEKIIGLDTSIITNLTNNKYDNATLSGNVLKFFANGVEKKSLTLPSGGSSGGGSGTPGQDGREIELSVQSGYIAWRYKGDSSWTNLVSLESLKGQPGVAGATGATGPAGSNGTNATINGMETLEIIGGTNISIEKNTSAKTITINSTVVPGEGGGSVDLSNYYTKGQVDSKDTVIKESVSAVDAKAIANTSKISEVTTQLENVKQEITDVVSNFTNEQTATNYILKYKGIVIANIPIGKSNAILSPCISSVEILEKSVGYFTTTLADTIHEDEIIKITSSNPSVLEVFPNSITFKTTDYKSSHVINIQTKGIVENTSCTLTLDNEKGMKKVITINITKKEKQLVDVTNSYVDFVGESKYFDSLTFGQINGSTKTFFELNGKGQEVDILEIPRDCWIYRKEWINGKLRHLYTDVYNKGVGTGSQFSELVILDENKSEIDRVKMIGGGINGEENYPCDPHEFMMLDDGHYVIMTYKKITPNNIPSGINLPKEVTMCWLQEVKDKKVIFDWKSTDHVHLYHDTVATNIDYIHINSIRIDDDNNFICSFRECCMCVKINRITGEVMWKLGGKNDQFGLAEHQKPKFQHDFRKTKDGTYTIFDNRTGESVSRICEYKIDEKTKKLIDFKEYKWKNYQGSYCGSAEKIENGVFLIGWGLQGNHPYDFGEYDFNTTTANFEGKYKLNNDTYKIFASNYTTKLKAIPIQSIAISKSTANININETVLLDKTYTPENTTEKGVLWTSNKDNIATVNSNGVVTGVAEGEAIITCTSAVNSNVKNTCTVTVTNVVISKPKAILHLQSSSINSNSTSWNDESGNNNNFRLFEGTPNVDSNGLLMTSVKVHGTTSVTLNGEITYNIKLYYQSDNSSGALMAFNGKTDNLSKYCDSRVRGVLRVNGYSGDTNTTLQFPLSKAINLTLVYSKLASKIKIYNDGVFHSEYAMGKSNLVGEFGLVLGSSSYDNFPINISDFRIKEVSLFDKILTDDEISTL